MGSTEDVTFNKEHMITKLSKCLDTLLDNGNSNAKKATFIGYSKKLTEVFVDLLEGAINDVRCDYVPREEFTKLQNDFRKLNDKFDAAQKRWDSQRDEMANQIDNAQQYSRRDNIKIIGIEPKTNEDVEQIVIDVVKDAGLDITKDDISIAHRINTKGDTTSNNETNSHGKPKKIPSIIARIKSRKLRNEIFKARTTLHRNSAPTHTGARIYDVTPLRSRILFALRNRKLPGTETKKYKFVWSNEGRIFARTEEESNMTINRNGKEIPYPGHVINKPQDLQHLGWTPEEILAIINIKVTA